MKFGGRFINPTLDVLLIGGVISLPVALWARWAGVEVDATSMWELLLLTTYAHVAASLVRLYSVPGVLRSRPSLTIAFPLFAMVATGALVLASEPVMNRVASCYVTWSSYHYPAQTYGIALLYIYKSGQTLSPNEKRFLQAACLATCAYSVLGPASSMGAMLSIPPEILVRWPVLEYVRHGLRAFILVGIVAAPVGFALYRWRRGQPLPLMSLVLIGTNALWWVVFPRSAFAWAALSHGIQYLVIAAMTHAKDRAAAGDPRTAYHVLTFYVACVALAYGLYFGGPPLYGLMSPRFSHSATFLRMALMLNFHHVILDGFIWKRRAPVRRPGAILVGNPIPAT